MPPTLRPAAVIPAPRFSWHLLLPGLLVLFLGLASTGRAVDPRNYWEEAVDKQWFNPVNWTLGVVPDTAAFFSPDSEIFDVEISGSTTLESLNFDFDAPAFTFTLTGTGNTLSLTGAGIVNDSSEKQTLIVGDASNALYFYNSASAGNATLLTGAGNITFTDSSSAADATLHVQDGGSLVFTSSVNGDPNLGSSHITVDAGGTMDVSGVKSNIFPYAYLSVGSIAGGGDILLGTSVLTIGTDNTSTTFSGSITGNDTAGLTKTGNGTFTLTGSLEAGLFLGQGTIHVADGGQISQQTGYTDVRGTLIVDGAGSSVETPFLSIGDMEQGKVIVQNGGSLGAKNGSSSIMLYNGFLQIGGTGAGADLDGSSSGGTVLASQIYGSSGTSLLFYQSDEVTLTASISGGFNLLQNGSGTTILAGAGSNYGATYVMQGTLVLDFTAHDADILGSGTVLHLGSGTLQIDRSNGATGTHSQSVAGTTLEGAATITRGSGSSAVLNLGNITVNTGASLDLSAGGIATTGNTNTHGILGYWATINHSDFAANATNASGGSIIAYTGYTDVTRLDSGPQVIADNASSQVRIVLGTGSPADITLASGYTQIDTLTQSAYGSGGEGRGDGNSSAVVDFQDGTLSVNAILTAENAGQLTLGKTPGGGQLTSGSTGQVVLQSYGQGLLVNASIVDNEDTAVGLTAMGGNAVTLAGASTYTGDTVVTGLEMDVSGSITGTASVTVAGGGHLTLQGGTVTTSYLTLGGAGTLGTLEVSGGGHFTTGTARVGHDRAVSGVAGTANQGVAVVQGEGSLLTFEKDVRVGTMGGVGLLLIQDGGTATLGGGGGTLYLGDFYGGSATLNFGFSVGTANRGGTLLASTINGSFGATVNFNQTDVLSLGASITGRTTVNQNGSGISVLDGTTNDYTGATNVHGGTLVLKNGALNGSTQITVDQGATLAVYNAEISTTVGDVTTIILNGTLMVGDPSHEGTAQAAYAQLGNVFGNSIVMGEHSRLVLNLFEGAGDGGGVGLKGGGADMLGLGSFTLNATAGGTLVIGNPNTMTGFAIGDEWQVLSEAPTILGELALDFTGLHLAAGLSGSFDQTTGIFSIIEGVASAPASHWLGGGADGKWSSANWASDASGTATVATPTSTDDITFSATGAGSATGTVLDADYSIHSLTVLNGAQVGISTDDENTLSVTGTTTVNGTLSLNDGAEIQSGGAFTVGSTGILAGNDGSVVMAANQNLYVNGAINVGNLDPGAAMLSLSTSGTGAIVMGAGSLLLVDLWSGAGAGDSTATVGASDQLELQGTLDASAGGTLVISNPNHLSGFANGDRWQVIALQPDSAINGQLALNISALGLSATQTGSLDQSTGVFQVLDTQPGLQTAAVQDQSLLSSMQGLLNDINGRLFSLRAGGGVESTGSIAEAEEDGIVLGEGDGPEDAIAQKMLRSRQWEVYATVNYANVRLNTIGAQTGARSYSWSPGVGIERHVSQHVAVGLAVSLLETHQTYYGGLGTLDMQGVAVSAYTSYASRHMWADVLYSFGAISLDTQRNAAGFPVALGSTTAYTHALMVNGGWKFHFCNDRLVTGPIIGLDYLNVAVDGYAETGGGLGALAYGSRSTNSLVSRVGWTLSHRFDTSIGTVTPQVRLSYERQNLTSNNGTSVNLINQPFSTTTNSRHPGQDYLVAGAGVNFQLSAAFNMQINYSGQFFRDNMHAHYVGLRFGYQF